MKKLYLILLFFFLVSAAYPQKRTLMLVTAKIVNGDTIPIIDLKEVRIYGKRIFKNRREEIRFNKLVRHVKKVYPYAKLCEKKMYEYEAILVKLPTERERRIFMREAEEQIKTQYMNEIKKLTFTQGKILLKLIDRQTGNTSYELLKEFRGSIRAMFWQSIARVFGANLKSEYDAAGDDKYIEDIIIMIEDGTI